MGAWISTPNVFFDLLTYPVSSCWASSGLSLDLFQLLAPSSRFGDNYFVKNETNRKKLGREPFDGRRGAKEKPR